MVTKLTNIEVNEVSLVDVPANKKKIIYKGARKRLLKICKIPYTSSIKDIEEDEDEISEPKECPICGRKLVNGKCPYCEGKTEVKIFVQDRGLGSEGAASKIIMTFTGCTVSEDAVDIGESGTPIGRSYTFEALRRDPL